MEARSATESPLQFSQSLYYGTVVLGSVAGTAVRDKAFPSELLRIQAQYPGFPVCSPSLFTYGPSGLLSLSRLLGVDRRVAGLGLTASLISRTSTRLSRTKSPTPQNS